jgi:hypothetical protein
MALEFVFGEQHRPENLLILPMKTQSFVWGMFNFETSLLHVANFL